MATKLLVLGVVLIMCLGLFAGCGGEKLPYNAVMYGSIYENRTWLKDDFYEANLTYGSYSSAIKDYVKDEDYPSLRTKIIVCKDDFELVFNEFPVDVDFEKTMIVMHCFTTASGSNYEIKNISVDEHTLIVKYKSQASKEKTLLNASMPLTKWVIITMDKLNIETAEFIFGN